MTVLFPRVRSRRARITRACTAALAPLLLAAAALVPVAISNSASAAPTPPNTFSCNNGAFILTSDGDITQASDVAGTWTTLLSTGKALNALAYNPEDRYLYAMLTDKVQKITPAGVVDMGHVTGLPAESYLAGAFDVDTGLYYVSRYDDLHAIDISTMTASSVSVPAGIIGVGIDFVISDSWLWTVRGNKVAGFNLAADEHKQYTFDTAIVPSGSTGGAMWMDPSGTTLFVQMPTQGEVAQFTGVGSASISTSLISSTNSVTTPIDGADCKKTILTVTPDAKSRTYGESAPSYTFDVAGFINGESAGTAAGYVAPICSSAYSSTTAVSASPLTITCSGGSADNYTFDTSATAQLTVSAKVLTVTPGSKSRTYGEPAPTYTFDVTGFAGGESAGTAAGYVAPTCSSAYLSTTAVSASPLTISCSGGSADNYTFDTTATANLVINYPTDSVDCSTNKYFRIATGTLSSGSSFLSQWNDIASMGQMRNGIAIRPADRRVYGFSARSTNVLYRGGIFGSQVLGAVSGLPAAVYHASDFDPSTGLLYVYSNRLGKLYSVDVDAMTATEVAVAAGYKFGFDIVVVNGHVWSYSEGSILSVRISNGNRLTWSTSPGISRSVLKNKSMVGAMWYDSATQTIYGEITSDGTLVKFSGIGSGTVVSSLVGASTGGAIPIDGATCS